MRRELHRVRCFASPRNDSIDSSPLNSASPRGADRPHLPEPQQAAGVFERQFAVLLLALSPVRGGPCVPEAKRLSSTAATVSQLKSGDAAGDQHAVVAQALHHRADHVDARADSSARAATVSSYFRSLAKPSSAASLSLPCLASRPTKRRGGGEIARARHFAVGAGGGQRRSRCGFPRTDAAARATTAACARPRWRCAAIAGAARPAGRRECRFRPRDQDRSRPASARWHSRSPTSARRDC